MHIPDHCVWRTAASADDPGTKKKKGYDPMNRKTEILKKAYRLEKHVEGGSFSESYTAPFKHNGRPIAGSIYFLLEAGEISHFFRA